MPRCQAVARPKDLQPPTVQTGYCPWCTSWRPTGTKLGRHMLRCPSAPGSPWWNLPRETMVRLVAGLDAWVERRMLPGEYVLAQGGDSPDPFGVLVVVQGGVESSSCLVRAVRVLPGHGVSVLERLGVRLDAVLRGCEA